MALKQAALCFPDCYEDRILPFTCAYSIDQYLIVEKQKNLVRAILFVLDERLDSHDYDTMAHHAQLPSGVHSGINDLDDDNRLDIERKLINEGISLLDCNVIHNNSLYIPFHCPTYGSDPDFLPKSIGEDMKWSLHILE